MKHLMILCGCLFLFMQPALADDEEEFEVQEEGQLFDHARTGLYFKRALYHKGENVTYVPYFPTMYNSTQDIREWKVYVSHAEQDPPSFVIAYINGDSPHPYTRAEIDLRVTVGHVDRADNMVPANQTIIRDIPIKNGINRIPMQIHNYKGDIVHVHLLDVRQKIPIKAIDVVD